MPPPVLVVQHEDQCPPAWFGDWLTAAGCQLDVRRPYAGEPLPDSVQGHAALVVLGGSMGAYDDQHPWLPVAKALVRQAAAERVPTLGICLGHQLCAVALGGHVDRNPAGQQLGLTEIGWLPAAGDDALARGLTSTRRGVHWNDDVVDALPPGAVVLAQTRSGSPQVVRFAPTVWGVQLHPEADVRVVKPWADGDRARHGDQLVETALSGIAAAGEELANGWRPLAQSLAALAGTD